MKTAAHFDQLNIPLIDIQKIIIIVFFYVLNFCIFCCFCVILWLFPVLSCRCDFIIIQPIQCFECNYKCVYQKMLLVKE